MKSAISVAIPVRAFETRLRNMTIFSRNVVML